jgi:hypothetical protein
MVFKTFLLSSTMATMRSASGAGKTGVQQHGIGLARHQHGIHVEAVDVGVVHLHGQRRGLRRTVGDHAQRQRDGGDQAGEGLGSEIHDVLSRCWCDAETLLV